MAMLSVCEVQEDQPLPGNATVRLQPRNAQTHLRFLFGSLQCDSGDAWLSSSSPWVLGCSCDSGSTPISQLQRLEDEGSLHGKLSFSNSSQPSLAFFTSFIDWFCIDWAVPADNEEF